MDRSRRTMLPLAITAALVAVPVLAGCSSGFKATSNKQYAPSDGILANTDQLRLSNVLVVASPSGTSGVVSTSIANDGDRRDRLTGLSSPDGSVDLTGNGALPAGAALPMGADTKTSATISGLTKLAGEIITLRFTFAKADPVTVRTVVVPATGPYASITAAPTPSPS